MLIRGVEVHKRRGDTIPDRQNAAVRIFKRLSSNEAVSSMETNRCMRPMKRGLGGRVDSNIVDDCWVYIGSLRPPPPPSPRPRPPPPPRRSPNRTGGDNHVPRRFAGNMMRWA
eukprot:2510868-Pyramimonas_sp.AAC.1